MPHRAAAVPPEDVASRGWAVVAHELRNPLHVLRTFLALLRRRGPADGDLARSLAGAERQLELLRRLVDDLERLGDGGWRAEAPARQRVPLRELVEQGLQAAAPMLAARGHALFVALDAGDHWVQGDPDRLLQVLANLLCNAAKFTPPGGHVGVRLQRDGDDLVLQVHDSGRGLDPAEAGRIFLPFARGRAAEGVPGLGLGLAVVRCFVEQHGGTVQAAGAAHGTGACFTVRLPAG